MHRRLLLTTLIAALCALALPAMAQAKAGQRVVFDAPRDLLNPVTRDKAFEQLDDLGVTAIRIILQWNDVAPDPDSRSRPAGDLTDPARYNWSKYAPAIEAADARGWPVLLTLSSPVPRWATQGALDHLTRPRPSDFQTFVTAAGRRFGAQVDTWSIWNEPNQYQFLLPQFSRGKAVSPGIYRRLFLAGRAGLDAAGLPDARVLAAETSPRGSTKVVAPLAFLRGTLCLSSSYKRSSSCGPLPADGWAHHPYATQAGPFFIPSQRDDVTLGVLSRLETALDRAARAGAVPARLPIWLTEFGTQSYPDRFMGVPLDKQSDYRSIAEYFAWRNPRVAAFSQYLLRDDQSLTKGPEFLRYPGFESGLEFAGGKRKPAYDGFRLPLVARPSGRRVHLWGLVRPARGATTVTVQRARTGGTFRDLMTVSTRADGSWTASTAGGSSYRWRVVWDAPGGTRYTGSTTASYVDTRPGR